MKKIILALLAAAPLCAAAQFSGLFKTDNQALVEQAINDGVVVVSQSYQLADSTGKRYGRYGNQEFGTINSVGYRVDSGLVVTDNIARPWEYDENFERYRSGYTPELYQTRLCTIGDSAACYPDSAQLAYKAVADGFYFAPTPTLKRGFSPRSYKGETAGWMAWIYSPKEADGEPTGEPQYLIVKATLHMGAKAQPTVAQTPADGKDYIGGVFLVPEQTAVGQLTFFLAGMAVMDNDLGEWTIEMPAAVVEGDKAYSAKEIVGAANELTPLVKEAISKDGLSKKDKKSKDKKKKK